jgi:protein tyrosine phosphatase type 4A
LLRFAAEICKELFPVENYFGVQSQAMSGTNNMRQKTTRPAPSEIEYKNMRFLIMDRPNDSNMPAFIDELKRRNAKDVVRVCEPTYKTDELQREGIRVLDWAFDDGTPPPNKIVEDWFDLLKTRFKEDPNCFVAVHCVAGLGRAPVLVALALIELGMKYEDAVEFIRQKRRGAINAKQLSYLEKYRPKSRLKMKNGHRQCVVQ